MIRLRPVNLDRRRSDAASSLTDCQGVQVFDWGWGRRHMMRYTIYGVFFKITVFYCMHVLYNPFMPTTHPHNVTESSKL